jgi:hypothetical protein
MDRRRFLQALLATSVGRPLAAEAQYTNRRLASLHPSPPELAAPLIAAFEKGLVSRGHVKGATTSIEYVFLPPSRDRLRDRLPR